MVARRHERVAHGERELVSQTRGLARETRDSVSVARECYSRMIDLAEVIGVSASERASLSVGMSRMSARLGRTAAKRGQVSARREQRAAGRARWRV